MLVADSSYSQQTLHSFWAVRATLLDCNRSRGSTVIQLSYAVFCAPTLPGSFHELVALLLYFSLHSTPVYLKCLCFLWKMKGCLDSVERGTVKWTVERWNSGMAVWAIDDPVPSRRISPQWIRMLIVALFNVTPGGISLKLSLLHGTSHRIKTVSREPENLCSYFWQLNLAHKHGSFWAPQVGFDQ